MAGPIPREQWSQTVTPTATESADLARLRMIARVLDNAVEIPGTRFRVGLDALLGLIPGVGDVVGFVVGTYVLTTAVRLGIPKAVIGRMLLNIGTDAALGSVPLAGDVFDAAWRANSKNVALLEKAVTEPRETGRRSTWLLVAVGVAVFLITVAGLALAIGLAYLLVRAVTGS
jgi:hypothetical protein